MRCETCGCVGVEKVYGLADRRERAWFVGLTICLMLPAIVYLTCVSGRPFCVRCERRVRGDGESAEARRRSTREPSGTPCAAIAGPSRWTYRSTLPEPPPPIWVQPRDL